MPESGWGAGLVHKAVQAWEPELRTPHPSKHQVSMVAHLQSQHLDKGGILASWTHCISELWVQWREWDPLKKLPALVQGLHMCTHSCTHIYTNTHSHTIYIHWQLEMAQWGEHLPHSLTTCVWPLEFTWWWENWLHKVIPLTYMSYIYK